MEHFKSIKLLNPYSYYAKNRQRCITNSLKYYYLHQKERIAYNLKYQKENPLRDLLCLIKQRCNYPKDKKYKYYGGKGIKNYLSYENLCFLWERDKAIKMKHPSIDRIDSNKDYTLENCQFIEMAINRIKRNY